MLLPEIATSGDDTRSTTGLRLARIAIGAAVVALVTAASTGLASPPPAPQVLSPAGSWDAPALAAPCPTFSWAGRADAVGYELVVFRVGAPGEDGGAQRPPAAPAPREDTLENVTLRRRLPAGATSWTPDLRSCLEAGGSYAWSLRVLGPEAGADSEDPWAEPAWLEVAAEPTLEEVERALDVLQRHRSARLRGAEAPDSRSLAPVRADDGRDARAADAGHSPRPSVSSDLPFEPLRQSTVGPRVTSAGTAPTAGTASLSVSQQVHLADDSAVFKGGELFLWDEVVEVYGGPRGTTALGRGALASNQAGGVDFSGTLNTALGYLTLTANTSGRGNTATGTKALSKNITGIFNTAHGVYALAENTMGNSNTAIGSALRSNTTGSSNTAVGSAALDYNTTGGSNTAVGLGALANNTTGSDNTALGAGALDDLTAGSYNVALGRHAGYLLYAGNSNILINSGGDDESNTLRIGRGTGTGTRQLNRAFIHGIAESTLTSGTAVFINEVTSELGTRSCGTYVAAAVCPIAGANPNGPTCNAVPAGSFCEGDGECGTSPDLDNCGTGDWYIRTQ